MDRANDKDVSTSIRGGSSVGVRLSYSSPVEQTIPLSLLCYEKTVAL